MTREDFKDWIEAYGCKPEPINGINVRGNAVCFINPTNGRYTYLSTPINEYEMPDVMVRRACINLCIPFPDCVVQK